MTTSGLAKHSSPACLRKASKDSIASPPLGARPKASTKGKANNSSDLTVKVARESPLATPLSSPELLSDGSSAPTRRPLPRVPSVSSLQPTPPPTPPAVAGPSSCRPRPLPRPPSTGSSSGDRYSEDESEDSDTSPSQDSKSMAVAATPRRAVKPLPVPIDYTDVTPRQPGRKITAKSLPIFDDTDDEHLDEPTPKLSCMPRSQTPPILPPISTFKRISLGIDTRTPIGWESKSSSPDSAPFESTPGFVFDFSRMPLGDASDAASEGSDYDIHNSIDPRYHDDVDFHKLPLKRLNDHSHEDQDYTWELRDDVLYRRKVREVPISKWYTEKKGKRMTERDYDNIRNVLRSL